MMCVLYVPVSDEIPFPAFEKIDLKHYAGYGMMTSRGCPYPCTFCSVAPIWNLESYSRSLDCIIDGNHHVAAPSQFGQLVYLDRSDHLVGDEDVLNAGLNHDLGLTDLGTGDAERPCFQLSQGDLGALVGFGVRP